MLFHLANGFAAHGYTVDLVLVQAKGELISQLSSQVKLIDLRAKDEYRSLPGLMRYLQHQQPSVMLSTLNLANIIAVLANMFVKTGAKLYLREASPPSINIRSRLKKIIEKPLFKFCYSRADGIIAVSQGVATDLSQYTGIPFHRITTIYNPAISADLAPKMQKPVTHPWFAAGEPPVVLGVGRLVEQKNFFLLLHAFQRVLTHIDARLVILGEGEQRSMLESLAHHLGIQERVSLPGFVDNTYSYMRKARIFVLSSLWEGLPNVLIEAMACGCPVISTDCPSGPAEILANGKYGVLVPPNDVDALAKAIVDVLTGKRKIRVEPAWLDQFKTETVVQKYLEVMGLE